MNSIAQKPTLIIELLDSGRKESIATYLLGDYS